MFREEEEEEKRDFWLRVGFHLLLLINWCYKIVHVEANQACQTGYFVLSEKAYMHRHLILWPRLVQFAFVLPC